MKKNKKKVQILIYILIATAILLFSYFKIASTINKEERISYSEFTERTDAGEIKEVVLDNDVLKIYPYQGNIYYVTANISPEQTIEYLESKEVIINGTIIDNNSTFLLNLMTIFLKFSIYAAIGFFLYNLVKKSGGLGSSVMSVGKNKSKRYKENSINITFKDVAGQEEAKESLVEIIDYLNNKEKYLKIGAKLPKGALLVGPPGTGKTLLAKAVAGEAKVPFFSLTGSDFVEMFVGVGASRVRDLFEEAKKNSPCIIFIDELDAIGKSRDQNGQGHSNDEREATLNQLLSEMDGFSTNEAIVVLAATNRPEILDKALLRTGRFDRRIIVDRPDVKGREAVLKVHIKDVSIDDTVDLKSAAQATAGASGSDLANIINESALRAVKYNRSRVCQEDIMASIETVFAGKEKKDRIMTEKERNIVAYHEVGHAVVSALQKNSAPVQKITIVPRTMGSLGFTMHVPEEEKYLISKDEYYDRIQSLLAGRCAEEVFFNTVTTGATNDIEKATSIVRNLITVAGMSNKFGMVALESMQNKYLDGTTMRNCSERTSFMIDEEISEVIAECYNKAKKIIEENKELCKEVAEFLLEKENISGEEFMEIFRKYYPLTEEEIAKKAILQNMKKKVESTAPLQESKTFTKVYEELQASKTKEPNIPLEMPKSKEEVEEPMIEEDAMEYPMIDDISYIPEIPGVYEPIEDMEMEEPNLEESVIGSAILEQPIENKTTPQVPQKKEFQKPNIPNSNHPKPLQNNQNKNNQNNQQKNNNHNNGQNKPSGQPLKKPNYQQKPQQKDPISNLMNAIDENPNQFSKRKPLYGELNKEPEVVEKKQPMIIEPGTISEDEY